MRGIFFDEDDARAAALVLTRGGFEATVVRERLAGEDDDEEEATETPAKESPHDRLKVARLLSPTDSDKENLSPDEDGNPRSGGTGRRGLIQAAGPNNLDLHHDTMVAAYLIDPARRDYGLAELAADDVGVRVDEAGHQRRVAQVDHPGTVRHGDARGRAGGGDAVPGDDDHGVAEAMPMIASRPTHPPEQPAAFSMRSCA